MEDFDIPTLLDEGGEPSEQEVQQALIAELRRRQGERAGLQANLGEQQRQAGGLRALSMLTSLGANPLLLGVQGEASRQGSAADSRAAQSAARLSSGGGDPTSALVRLRGLKLAADKERGVQGRFDAAQEQRGAQFAQTMGFRWANLDATQKMALLNLMDRKEGREDAAGVKRDDDARKTAVRGLEVTPGATPTPDDAKTVKGVMTSSARLGKSIADMRALHKTYGTEFGGKGGTRMKQALTAIALEAKNIAELGALSGPDQGLMEALAGGDPTTIEANAKAFFGVDNTEEAMLGLETWMANQVGATLETRGYRRPAAQATPGGAAPATRAPPAQPLPPGKARIRLKNGQTMVVDIVDLAEALKDPDVAGQVK